jgi:signal transduction histidine kinase
LFVSTDVNHVSVLSVIRKYGGVSLLAGIGAGLFLVHVWHALGEEETIQKFLLGIIIPMVLAGSVFVGGLRLWQQGVADEYMLRVGAWCALGAAVLALAGVFVILYQQRYDIVMAEQLFVVTNGASGGALVGFVTGVYDIRQRRAQDRANQLTRQLTVLNRVLRHDIRNSANIIQGNADLLTQETVDAAAKADTIKQQAIDMVELGDQAKDIEQLLLDGGATRERVDIVPLAQKYCRQIQRDYPSAEIDLSLPPALPVVTHRLIGSALMNVIENAVEHNDKRTPCVTVESTVVSRGGTEYVELQIADNGPGMADSEIDVLSRGYETDLEHTSGLGLWLVNWVVTNVDGEVQFEDNEPEGSIVRIRLKRAGRVTTSDPVSNTADAVE